MSITKLGLALALTVMFGVTAVFAADSGATSEGAGKARPAKATPADQLDGLQGSRDDQRPGAGRRMRPKPGGLEFGRLDLVDDDGPGPGRDHEPGFDPGPGGPGHGPGSGRNPERPDGPGGPKGPLPPSARWPRGEIESIHSSDPEMYSLMKQDVDLDRQSRKLALQYRQATGEQRAKLKQQIEQTVDKHFEVRQERRALELRRLEDELKRLHESHERRTKARKELVDKRVSELLGPDEGLHF